MELGSTPKQPSKNSAVRLSDKVLQFHGALVYSQNKTSLIYGQIVISPVHLIQFTREDLKVHPWVNMAESLRNCQFSFPPPSPKSQQLTSQSHQR